MAEQKRIYYHSVNNGSWEQIGEVFPRSVVGVALANAASGQVYEDRYGHRYKWLPAPSIPQQKDE